MARHTPMDRINRQTRNLDTRKFRGARPTMTNRRGGSQIRGSVDPRALEGYTGRGGRMVRDQAQSGKGKTGTLGMLSTMMARGIQNKRRKGQQTTGTSPRTATTSALKQER